MNDVNKQLQELESLLKEHDWYYAYSDDHRVWKRGEEERKVIGELTARLMYVEGLSDAVDTLYEKYSK